MHSYILWVDDFLGFTSSLQNGIFTWLVSSVALRSRINLSLLFKIKELVRWSYLFGSFVYLTLYTRWCFRNISWRGRILISLSIWVLNFINNVNAIHFSFLRRCVLFCFCPFKSFTMFHDMFILFNVLECIMCHHILLKLVLRRCWIQLWHILVLLCKQFGIFKLLRFWKTHRFCFKYGLCFGLLFLV
jgi:hypothetical protein